MASPEGRHASTPSPLPRLSEPHGSPAQEYQDEDETWDSKLKAMWDSEMGGLKRHWTPYTKVSVLLLSWHKDIDDLKTDKEVTDLENLFKNKFMFETTRKILTKDSRTSAQAQVNHYLAKFVYKNDNLNTMLIIYYAGHGRPGNDRGKLKLTASTSLRGESNGDLHEIVWNSAENNIKKTSADVLVIFDCCHAGLLELGVRGYRAFEYLAATSANSTTRKPGPQSFTSALIWSLDNLLKRHAPFSTQELLRTINVEAPDFPEDQCPRLAEGPHPTERKIMLAPLTKESIEQADKATQHEHKDDLDEERRRDLHLRFTFDCGDLTEHNLKRFAGQMKNLLQHGGHQAKAVSWEGIYSPSFGPSPYIGPGMYHTNWKRAAISHFSRLLRRIRSRGEVSPAGGPRLLPNNGSEAPASERFAPTPAPSHHSADLEIGEAQGVSTEKAVSPSEGGRRRSTLQEPSPPSGGQGMPDVAHPQKAKRKQGVTNEGDCLGPAAAVKRRRNGRSI